MLILPKSTTYTFEEALPKIAAYCAYQERCHQEVEEKLYSYGLIMEEVAQAIHFLETENYLNELRFAQSFVRGKFNHNKWGKIKISFALKQKQVSSACIEEAFLELNEVVYFETLQQLLTQKIASLKKHPPHVQRQKAYNFAATKGFESELIRDVLASLIDR